jgi:peptidoglycan-associated lipoprotein
VGKPALFNLSFVQIQFAFDDYPLSAPAEKTRPKTAAWMKQDPSVKVQIQENPGDIGTAEDNRALGDRRANSAKAYVEAPGVNADGLSTISYGEEKPRVPNTNEANRSSNRRDDFVTGQ